MNEILEIIGTRIPKLQNFKLKKDGKLTLVLSLANNDENIISLNETATLILSLCDGYNDINAIAETVANNIMVNLKKSGMTHRN